MSIESLIAPPSAVLGDEAELGVESFDLDANMPGVVFYVVGDKFSNFSDNNTILTYGDALEHVKLLAQIAKGITIGQGISLQQVLHLQEELRAFSPNRPVRLVHQLGQKIAKELVDKSSDQNVLITIPEQEGDLKFQSDLVFDDSCAEMADYLAGEHIQGALLIEAARQMFVACVKIFQVAPEFSHGADQTRYTLNKLEVSFENFVFPLAAKLKLTLGELEINDSFASGCARVKVCQFDRVCCEIKFYATAYSAKFFTSLEKRSAIKAKRRLIFDNLAAYDPPL